MSVLINYLGHSSFRIKADGTLITDPYDISTGFHFSKQIADIVTISHGHSDHANKEGIKNENCFFIEGPGEYEIKDIMVHGFSSYHDESKGAENGKNNIYVIEAEGIRMCHLGDLGTIEINERAMKEISGCNVLFIPVGGVYTIDAKKAKEVIKVIEPNFVVPMHYKVMESSETFGQLASVDDFLKEMGVELEPVEKLIVSENNLPDETEIVLLSRKK